MLLNNLEVPNHQIPWAVNWNVGVRDKKLTKRADLGPHFDMPLACLYEHPKHKSESGQVQRTEGPKEQID